MDLVCKAWEEESKSEANPSISNGEKDKQSSTTEAQKALRRKIEHTGMGGLSFFAWFGFIGRRVSAAESAAATALEGERRERRRKDSNGKTVGGEENGAEEDDDEDEDLGMSLEIFPDGDDLAVAITEDLWPGAIKYFSEYLLISSSHPLHNKVGFCLSSLCSSFETAVRRYIVNHRNSTSTRARRIVGCRLRIRR